MLAANGFSRVVSAICLVFVLSFLLSIHIVRGHTSATIGDLFFAAGYDIDIHWQLNGAPIYAIQSRPSNNIFILDQAFNVTAQLDPNIDTALMGVTAFGPKELAWSSDGNYLAVIHDSGIGEFVQIWNMTNLTPQTILTGIFQNLRWQPGGHLLAVAEEQRGIIIYDVAQEQVRHEFVLPVGAFASDIEWKPDGSQIVGLNSQSVVQVWDVTSGSTVFQLNFQVEDLAGEKAFIDLTWAMSQNYLVIHDWTRGIEIWDTVNENLIDTLPTSTQPTIEWFEEGIVSYGLNIIEILDASNGILKQTITVDGSIQIVDRNPITGELIYFVSKPDTPFQELAITESIMPFVSSFTLINADTNMEISPLNDNETVDLTTLDTSNLAIRANTTPVTVGSVIFDLNGTAQTDDTAPHEFTDWTPTRGAYTLTATPYSESGGAGNPLTIHFRVVDGS